MSGARAKVVSVYAVVGSDRFLRGDALERLLTSFADSIDVTGVSRVEGSRAVLAEVLDDVRTMSLLGGRRVVIVDDADAFVSAHRRVLERYCSAPADNGVLILLCDSLPKNTRLYKIICEHGSVIPCEAPRGRSVLTWITQRSQNEYGKPLVAPGAQVLREQIGDSPGLLNAELAKLAAYVGDRPHITPADIDALTGHHRMEKVFAVTDAMSSGDTAAALRNWEQVWTTDRAAPNRAIAGLAWGVRRLLQARRDWEAGANVATLARRMYTDPDVLQRRLTGATVSKLKAQQCDLLEADVAVKTGASTVAVAVEKFIVKHTFGGTMGDN